MSRRDTMCDPRYSGIPYAVESELHAIDASATTRKLTLTDSNIRSLLIRAINNAKGKTVKSAETIVSDKDRFLLDALHQLAAVRATIVEERNQPDGSVERRPLPASDWIAALGAR